MLADVVSIGTPTLCHWSQEVGGGHKPYDDLIIGGGAFCGNNQFPGHASPDYGQLLHWAPRACWSRLSSSSAGRRTRPSGRAGGHEAVSGGPGGAGDQYAAEARRWPGRVRPQPARELLEIAEICDRCLANLPKVSGRPSSPCGSATSVSCWRTGAPATPSLRIDQYLDPYYEADRAKGLSCQEAYEYLAMLLINCNSACVVYSECAPTGLPATTRAAPSPSAASSPTAAAPSTTCPI